MKLRVLFLKKIHLMYFIMTLLLIIALSSMFSSKDSNQVLNIVADSKTITADFSGDGVEDILYIKTEKDKYYVQINVDNKSYYLEPNRKLNTMGRKYPYWPMKITLLDITRDKIPEIFIQSYQKNTPIQHIFTWTGRDFKDMYCSSNNIIGFIDSHNNRTPKFISGNIVNNKPIYTSYMLIGNLLQNVTLDNNFYGQQVVYSFIKYIESLPDGETNKPKDIFADTMDGKSLSPIGKLCADNNYYSFQDSVFMDTKYDKNGSPTEVQWTLSFRGIGKTAQSESKCYTLSLKLKNTPQDKDNFKIYSIQLQ
jgi:hypothetical protein